MASRVGSVHGAVGIWLDYSKAGKSFGSSDFRVLRCSYAHLLITRILPLRGATLQRDTRYTRTTPTLAPPLDLPLLPRPLRPPPRCELTPFPRLSASPLRSAAAPLAAAACPSRSALSARLAAAATCSSRRGPSLRRARQGGPSSAGRHAQAHRLGLSCQ